MDVLKAALDILCQYPGLQYSTAPNAVHVDAPNPNGFPVSLEVDTQGFKVSLAGWHETFQEAEDALECFAFAFSRKCRIHVVSRGNTDCAWTLQFREGNTWNGDSTVGTPNYRVWRAKEERYLHNIL